jgi:formylglycine-generating enzyme required for sulfatase activity/uncharacterized caspase-like protein
MSKNWAIAIGINNYNPNNFKPLKYAKRDAESMRDFFLHEAKFDEVCFFSDDSPDLVLPNGAKIPTQPTYGNLMSFLHDRFERTPFLSAGDNCWFFFAGHGEQHANRDYLMPQDANPRTVERTAIPVSYVRERLSRSGADNVILILDACRTEGSRAASGIGKEPQQGAITISSCSPSQKSWEIDELQQGAFTYALLEALRMSGERNCATVERLDQYLRYRVPELCQKYGRYPEQNPRIAVDPAAKFYFILIPQYAAWVDADIKALKMNAYRAQLDHELDLAEQLWIRVNAAAQGRDMDAIKAFQKIAQMKAGHLDSPTLLQASNQSLGNGAFLPVEPSTSTGKNAQPSSEPPSLSRSSDVQLAAPNRSAEDSSISSPIPALAEKERRLLRVSATGIKFARSALRQKKLTQQALAENCGLSRTTVSRFMRQEPINCEIFEVICKALELTPEEIADNPSGTLLIPNIPKTQPSGTVPLPSAKQIFGFEVILVNERGQEVERHQQTTEYCAEELVNGLVLDMVLIPGGTFLMGSPKTELGRLKNEEPQHPVTIKPFLMSKYPITQAQWKAVASFPKIHQDLELDPSDFKGANRPVEQVSWHDAVEFCVRLSKKTGHEYRLPTEAEWEYACRAGTTTPFHFGETITPELANYDCNYSYKFGIKRNYRKQTSLVGDFQFANAFGLFDMHGNIWEWCIDHWHESYDDAPMNGTAWITDNQNQLRVLRGGSWYNDPRDCRSAFRYNWDLDDRLNRIGFRVVCPLV